MINKHRLLQKIYSTLAITIIPGFKKAFEKIRNHLQDKFNIIRQNALFDPPFENVILRHVLMALVQTLRVKAQAEESFATTRLPDVSA